MCNRNTRSCGRNKISKQAYFQELRTVAILIVGLFLVSWIFAPQLRPLSKMVWLGGSIFMGMRYLKNFGFDFNLNGNDSSKPVRKIPIDDADVV
ncbi:MAG: hypothetical protein AAFY36_05725 [Bacteroidota bacterium]